MSAVPYDINERPEWVRAADLAVVEVYKRSHANWWSFDPRPYTDEVLSAFFTFAPSQLGDETP